ncbi:hypothetical protein [Streptomyces viridochromogenes]|nr:hypothetical protein [Streptomyces viridochromogenes]
MTSPEPQTRQEARRTGGKVVHLHTAHPRVPIPYVTPGDMFSGARKATSTATTTATSTAMGMLPSPRKLAFYGILGGMTAAGAMAWPVAVAIGAATEVITREQDAHHRRQHESMRREGAEAGHEQSPPPSTAERAAPGTTRQTATG